MCILFFILFYFFFLVGDFLFFFILFYLNLQYCIGFAIYENESATGIYVFPILNPPPSSLPIPSLLIQLLKHWLCNMQSGIVVENRSHRCCLQALQFLVHLIDLLSILLRYNGFTGIQKVVGNQIISRPPNCDHDLFFWCKFGFGKCLGASLFSYWAGHCWLSYTNHFSSHLTIQLRNGSCCCKE